MAATATTTKPADAPELDVRGALTKLAIPRTPWFAVLDAAVDPNAPYQAAEFGLRRQSLYEGSLGKRVEHVAPHLISFDPQNPFAEWLFKWWRRPHGILLQSSAAFEDVRRHFRRFLLVRNDAGKKFRLRFYDPRVLRPFLTACNPDELSKFFGPVSAYYAAGRRGRSVWAFRWDGRQMESTELPVAWRPL